MCNVGGLSGADHCGIGGVVNAMGPLWSSSRPLHDIFYRISGYIEESAAIMSWWLAGFENCLIGDPDAKDDVSDPW